MTRCGGSEDRTSSAPILRLAKRGFVDATVSLSRLRFSALGPGPPDGPGPFLSEDPDSSSEGTGWLRKPATSVDTVL